MKGTFPAKKKDGSIYYRASVTYRKKHISLGSYPTQQEAHAAYHAAGKLLSSPEISIMDYPADSPLSFEKWVILINFRDNHVYFSTPIYICSRFFYYYLSRDHVLKFDVDDLFYYSSHKIMKRGGHYFVAEFGMQTNILTRYGIKNYAVCGRDYRFQNGDPTDFRRENLLILNRYHGVSYEPESGRYKARIHINGNYLIGRYDTMEEAAIAYNKAIDILRKNGCRKNYIPNYLENISAGTYAEIYMHLPVSRKLNKIIFPSNQ